MLPDGDRDDHNPLSGFEFPVGHTQPPAPENSSMNAEPSRNDPTHPNPQDHGNDHSRDHPSYAPPDLDGHPSTLLSPFRLSTSLRPRSNSIEPSLGGQERMLEIQHELNIANEGLATKAEDLNELRELVDRLKDRVT